MNGQVSPNLKVQWINLGVYITDIPGARTHWGGGGGAIAPSKVNDHYLIGVKVVKAKSIDNFTCVQVPRIAIVVCVGHSTLLVVP